MQSRMIFRLPLGMCENFGNKIRENVMTSNIVNLNIMLLGTLVLGKGAEKLVCRGGPDSKIEWQRRV